MSIILSAIKTLKQNKIINLTHEVVPEIPHFPIFKPITYETLVTIEEGGFLSHQVSIGTQYGTHIDAPIHFAEGKRTLNEVTFEERMLPLYVLHFEEEVACNPDFTVTEQMIKGYEAKNVLIQSGDLVALATGWSKHFSDPVAFINADEEGISHTPGWSISALEYLNKKGVTAIGHETINTDSGIEYAKAGFLNGEKYWLEQDKYQVELLTNLDQVPTQGAVIFIGVPHISGVSGFTCEVVAFVPKEV